MRPGEQLRELRNRLGVTTREVEEFSRTIAEDRHNEEFYISNAWLTQLENKASIPSIYKLYSLSVIYRTKFQDLLGVFGIDLDASARYQIALPLQNTHLASLEAPDPQKAITFPVRFDKSFTLEKTSLIARMVEVWGEVPVALIQKLDVRHCQYGYVGIHDYTMSPLLRPGSFVQIESRPTKTDTSEWRSEFTGQYFSWNCATGMLVPGAKYGDRRLPFNSPPSIGLQHPTVCLSFGSRNYWAGNRRCNASGAAGGGVSRRRSKIVKAILKFENRKLAVRSSVPSGTATR